MTRIFAAIIIAAGLIACSKKMVKAPTPATEKPISTGETYTSPPESVVDAPIEVARPAPFPGGSLFFGFNVDTLKNGQKRITARIATWLNLNPGASITVLGYADTSGPAAYNQKLSVRRAARVRAWLLDAGIESHRILFEGHGELRGPPAKCRKATVTLN